jgi:protoheme ferro-lyase
MLSGIYIPSRIYLLCILYTFYVTLLEKNTFELFWLEALADLARYHIVIAVMVPTEPQVSSLTTAAVNCGL